MNYKANRQRARDKYRKFNFILNGLSYLLGLLPQSILVFIFNRLRNVQGVLGLGLRYVLVKNISQVSGEGIAIFETVFLKNVQNLTIGSNVSIHSLCYIDCHGGLSIGSDVSIAHNVTIMTSSHVYDDNTLPIRDTPGYSAPVVIEDNVWIGAGVRILAGTEIGSGSVIGAGSVVTKSIPRGSVAHGVPAVVQKLR